MQHSFDHKLRERIQTRHAGCAGLCALLFLIHMLRRGGSASGAFAVEVDVDMTLLGFWVPFAGAIAATVVSVKRLMKPA